MLKQMKHSMVIAMLYMTEKMTFFLVSGYSTQREIAKSMKSSVV